MTDQQAISTAEHIGGIFPTVKPPMMKAIIQELINGRYDADKVMTWANWRRAETSAFSLDEMRTEFINDQPKRPRGEDARTAAYLRQRNEIEENYAAGQPEREQMNAFFDSQSDEDLTLLQSDYIATCPTEAHAGLACRDPRTAPILRHGIWAMVKGSVTK